MPTSVVELTKAQSHQSKRGAQPGAPRLMPKALAVMSLAVLSLGLAACSEEPAADSTPNAAANATANAAAMPPIRFCADPDNLPFASSSAENKGLYLEYAEALAAAMGRGQEMVWFKNIYGKRAVRSTLLEDKCDMYVGLPADGFMEPRVAFSKPFVQVGFALITPKAQAGASLDAFKGKKVAAQFSTPGQFLLADRTDLELVTVMSPEEGMETLAAGKADAAILWGPSAGYLNKTLYNQAYAVHPIDGRGMQWQAAIGFRPEDEELRAAVDVQIDALATTALPALIAKYGFPTEKPMALSATAAPKVDLAETPVDTTHLGPAEQPAPAAEPVKVADAGKAPSAADIAKGNTLFNNHCSHCHGPDAAGPESKTDLRRMTKRHKGDFLKVFDTTVAEGRESLGMPKWAGVLKPEEIKLIRDFVVSVQPK